METTMKHIPVAGPIVGLHRSGKGTVIFEVLHVRFSLPENSTYAKMIRGASRAIVVYEDNEGEDFPRIIEVIPSYTWQQVVTTNSLYCV